MSKQKESFLKGICEPLGIVVSVRNLSTIEQEKILYKLKSIFLKSEKIIKITDYAREIIKIFLESPEAFFEFVKKDRHLNSITEDGNEVDSINIQTEILASMYESIIELYPQFRIQNICSNVNDASRRDSTDPERIVKELTKDIWTVDNKAKSDEIIINKNFIKETEAYLRSKVIGQNHVIEQIVKNLKLLGSNLSSRFTMFFIGSTGTGKSLCSKSLGDAFRGRFIQVNCNEYTHGHEHNKLIGAPPGYIGHAEKSYLKEKAEKSNQWVFLFDEIEKANPKFFDFLLTLMDEGRVTDNHGANLDFTKSILIFTSNQGMDEINTNPISFAKGAGDNNLLDSESQIRASMKKKFRPEFLNRIDEMIFFNNLTKENVEKIVKDSLTNYNIVATQELIDFVVKGGYSVEYGAREVNRFIKNNVLNILSEDIISFGRMPKTTYYIPKLEGNSLIFTKG